MTTTPPSEGERRALSGYVPQYLVAAELILQRLRQGDFEWIRLVDPQVGQVDDIQIATGGRVDAYQVKWSRYASSFTFHRLTEADKPSLFVQLADGWKSLRELHPNAHVVVHLLTNDYPSPDANILESSQLPSRHFAAFIRDSWSKRFTGEFGEWQPIWEKLHKTSTLSAEDFATFFRSCELDFEYKLTLDTPSSIIPEAAQQDLLDLYSYLMLQVRQSLAQKVVHISRNQLLSTLGWNGRYEYRHRHSYPVDEVYYTSIEDAVRQIDERFATLTGGYIALVGSAGSGKSTLLTQYLHSKKSDFIIRYYAYVPDDEIGNFTRGETTHFYHDVNTAIHRRGISTASIGRTREEVVRQFHENLQLLGRLWKEKRLRTIILLDGLDHISREQSPHYSLLKDLPLPGQIPHGVYILLGTRTDHLDQLPWEIRKEIRQHERRVELQSLGRQGVYDLVDRYPLSATLSFHQKETVLSLSEGHPLTLVYILKRLQEVSEREVDHVLGGLTPFEGDIQNEYEKYWDKYVTNNDDLKRLLALVSRMRRAIDLEWLEKQFPESSTRLFVGSAQQYFRQDTPGVWYFHHSSFRLFLERKSVTTIADNYSKELDLQYHHQLAELFAHTSSPQVYNWEQLHHYIKADALDQVIGIAKPEWFRSQLLALRPIRLIRADINTCLHRIAAKKNVVLLTRMLLLSAEFEQREFYLDAVQLAEILISLGKVDVALLYVRQGQDLLVEAKEALDLSVQLWGSGYKAQGRVLFDLAEPKDRFQLDTVQITSDHIDGEFLDIFESWVTASIHYRTFESVYTWIRRVHCEPVDQGVDVDSVKLTQSFQAQLLRYLGNALINNERFDEVQTIIDRCELASVYEAHACFWLYNSICTMLFNLNRKEEASNWFDQLHQFSAGLELRNNMKVALAEGAYRILNDAALATHYAQTVIQPSLRHDVVQLDAGVAPFDMRFRVNRLLYALGERHELSQLVPDAQESREQRLVYFERGICVLAHIWGEAWQGNTLSPSEILSRLQDWIRFFYLEPSRQPTNWYIVRGAQADYFELMVKAVAQHGSDSLAALYEAIVKEWVSASATYWPIDVKRKLILAFLNHNLPIKDWAIQQLQMMQEGLYEKADITGQIDASKAYIDTWLQIGETERAERLITTLLLDSFGVGYRKDYQFNHWIDWLERINVVEPDKALIRIEWFARSIATLKETTEGRAVYLAANRLLGVTYQYDPFLALALFRWFLRQHFVTHESGILEILNEISKSPDGLNHWIFTLIGDFLLQFSDLEDTAYRLFEPVKNAASVSSHSESVHGISSLVQSVNTAVLSKYRDECRHELARAAIRGGLNIEQVGLGDNDLFYSDASTPSKQLILEDGRRLSSEQVIQQIQNLRTLKQFLQEESEESYFRWHTALESCVYRFSKDAVHDLSEIVEAATLRASSKTEILLSLARRLSSLNDPESAWQLGLRSLHYSEKRGWYPFYSDDRPAIFAHLKTIKPETAIELAWKDFMENILRDDFQSFTNLLGNLDSIVEVLSSSVPLAEVWQEIDSYLQILIQTNLERVPIEFSIGTVQKLSASAMLAHLLTDYIAHPVDIVAHAADRAIGAMLFRKDPVVVEVLLQRELNSNDLFRMHLLAVLHAVALYEPALVSPFETLVRKLTEAENFGIRMAAVEVGSLMGMNTSTKLRSSIRLPAIYSLVLPEEQPLIYERDLLLGHVRPDSRFASDILRLFEIEIEALSELTSIPEGNIRARMMQIMNEQRTVLDWTEEAEQKLQRGLQNTGLRFTCVRPRNRAALVSYFRVVGELFDSEQLSSTDLVELGHVMRFYDPNMILVRPHVRPIEVRSILTEEIALSYVKPEWKDQISDDDLLKIVTKLEGNIVLGEYTKLALGSDGNPVEIRQSQIGSQLQLKNSYQSPEQFFKRVFKIDYSQYANLDLGSNSNRLVIFHSDYGYISQNGNWLAFNPTIAQSMGWRLSEIGRFRWVNPENKVMVESIWWVDNTTSQSDLTFQEVGEGWLVVASVDGWQVLKQRYPEIHRHIMLERQYYVERRRTRNYHLSKKLLDA